MKEIKCFLKSHKIGRHYFSKKVLSKRGEYFIEILNYPIKWDKLTKKAKEDYQLLNDFLLDEKKKESFIENYLIEVEKSKIKNEKKVEKLPIMQENDKKDEIHKKNADSFDDDVIVIDEDEDEDMCINIKCEFDYD